MSDYQPAPLVGFSPVKVKEKETTRDRMILYLVAQGCTDGEVAQKLGCTSRSVSLTRRQPWFMEELVKLLHGAGMANIEKRLQAVMPELIELGMNLARNAESEAVRATSIFSMAKLARGDKVIVQDERKSPAELRAEKERLERELAELKGEIAPRFDTSETGAN